MPVNGHLSLPTRTIINSHTCYQVRSKVDRLGGESREWLIGAFLGYHLKASSPVGDACKGLRGQSPLNLKQAFELDAASRAVFPRRPAQSGWPEQSGSISFNGAPDRYGTAVAPDSLRRVCALYP